MRARRLMAMVVSVVTALAMAAVPAVPAAGTVSTGDSGSGSSSSVGPFLPIQRQYIEVPDAVQPWLPTWSTNGKSILFQDHLTGEVWVTRPDGTGTRCINCDFEDNPELVGFTYAFPDNKRLFLSHELGATGGSDDPANADAYVLECAPSILRCAQHRYLPVDMSADKGDAFIVQRRTWHLAPDGVHLGWMDVRLDGTAMIVARLSRLADRYVALDPRVVNPPGPSGDDDRDATGWENLSQLWELKSFADGGRSVLVVGVQKGNFDVYKVDLATGRSTRLTANPDWDEDGAIAPDGGSQVVYSWRSRDRLTAPAWFPGLPNFLGLVTGISLAAHYVSSWPGFQCDLSPWLLNGVGDDEGRRVGQPLDVYSGNLTAANNLSGLPMWSPDSTAVLLQERLRTPPPAGSPVDVATKGLSPNRVAIARLDRKPTRPQRTVVTKVGDWAPAAVEWDGPMSKDRTVTVDGPRGGTATITYTGDLRSGWMTAHFERFSSDGATFYDGDMSAGHTSSAAPWVIDVDVRASGASTGQMTADLRLNDPAQPVPNRAGEWTAVLDGETAPPLPDVGQCYDKLPKPTPLRLDLGRAKAAIVVTVTADIAGDVRPVRNATVTDGVRTVKTNRFGRATLPRHHGHSGQKRSITVTAGDTFLPAHAKL